MISIELLRKHGLTQENLEKWLSGDPLTWVGTNNQNPQLAPAGAIEGTDEYRRHMLLMRIRSRIQEGMTRNFSQFHTYYALDRAWDTPFRQVSPTLLETFLSQDPNSDQVYKAMQDWGLTNFISERHDPKTGKTDKCLNVPMFFEIIVPLVRAYVTIRWAKIMNDRRQVPFFKYEPAKNTVETSAKCEAVSDRIEVMSNQFGYYDVIKQGVLKMLHYGTAFIFPKREWESTEQFKKADDIDVAIGARKADGGLASKGDEISAVDREGIAYHIPHPTRMYYDLAHPPYTLNYGYGCTYAGYWRIARYREILTGNFWNKDYIALGTFDLVANNRLFFTTVYSACTINIPLRPTPKTPEGPVLAAEMGVAAGNLDREKEIATIYYGTQHGDQGVLTTEHWELLVPKDEGLGTYDKPIWMRFVVAGDSCTVLYAAPVPYDAVIYLGYDADESRSKNASLALETLPFQDHFSNMLSQILLTCKQNLANLTLLDEDQLMTGDPSQRAGQMTTMDRIRNIGEKFYRYLNVFSFSGKKASRLNSGKVAEVAQTVSFPKGNVQELTNVLHTILEILERVLVMSSQEIAQAASHELRVDEVRAIQSSTSSRLQFTATPVDIGMNAMKRQLYVAWQNYGDPDFQAHVPIDDPSTLVILQKIGFKLVNEPHPKDRFARIRGKTSMAAVDLWTFAGDRGADQRFDSKEEAAVLGQLLQQMLATPMLADSIGADQAIDLCNVLWKLAGLPADKKLRNVNPNATPQQQKEQAQQQLAQVVQIVTEQVNQGLQKELTPLLDLTKKNAQEIQLIFRALNLNLNVNPANDIGQTPPTNGAGAGGPPPMAQPARV